LEPLEPRVLLAADLSGLVTAHTLQDPSVPTNVESATVQVQNIGNQRANATTQVAVYASLDNTLDGSDVLLGTANTNGLNAGQSRNVNVNLNVGPLTPGNYTLLARVDNTNVIAEGAAGEANNIVTGPSFDVVWQFGAVPGRTGNTNLTLRDADGTNVIFSLLGGGTGEVLRDGTQWDVRLTGTTAQSIFTVLGLGGNNRVSLDDIQVQGPIGAVVAANTDLTGTLAVTDPITAGILFRSADGATITAPAIQGVTIQGVTVQGVAIVNSLTESTIQIGGTLGNFFVGGSMTGSTVQAGSITSIRVNGTLSADSGFLATSLPANATIGGQTIVIAGDPRFISDSTAPILTAGLKTDTGTLATDRLTMDPTIVGRLTDSGGIASFQAGFTSTPIFDVLADLEANGSFEFSRARLEQINGGPLQDGAHTLTLLATDLFNRTTQMSVPFTLDTTLATPTLDLDAASDSAPAGDQQTTSDFVTLTGQTDPNASVELFDTLLNPLGTATADATGVFSFAGVALLLGPNTFAARATDVAGNERTVSQTITRIIDLLPISNQTVDEGSLVTFTAQVVGVPVPFKGVFFTLERGAKEQTVPPAATIDANGVFSWTPAEGDGPFAYTFTVVANVVRPSQEVISDREVVTITVNEVNQPPVLQFEDGTDFTTFATDVAQDSTKMVDLQGVDPEGDELTFTLENAPKWVHLATLRAGGVIVTLGPDQNVVPGIYTFDVVLTDNGAPALSDRGTITVTVTDSNAAPVLAPIGNKTVNEGELLIFQATATDADLPADTLTFSFDTPGLRAPQLDPNTGFFTWTPGEGSGGQDFVFEIIVTDNGTPALTDRETITVTVTEVNAAPVLDPIGNQTVNEGEKLNFTATATDADIPANTLTFSLANAPAEATIDPNTGAFSWTPNSTQVGNHTFDVVVTDNGTPALSDSETIMVTVNELAPVGTIFWSTDQSGDWNNPSNWNTGSLPGISDIVVIDRPGVGVTVTRSSGSATIKGLISTESLVLSGGVLTVTETANITGSLRISGATLTASGSTALFRATGPTVVGDCNLFAVGGARMELPTLISYTQTGGFGVPTNRLQAIGANSILDLSSVTTITGPTSGFSEIVISAADGGIVNLSSLANFVVANFSTSTMMVVNGGNIVSPNLSFLTGVSLISDGTGSLDTDQLTAVVNGGVTVTGGTLDLSNVTDLHGTLVTLSSGGKTILTNAANINEASFIVNGGVTLSLPAAVTYQHTGGSNDDRMFRAGGAGSALDLSALTAITVSGNFGADLHVEALNGGHIDLSGVTTISEGLSSSLGGTQILADGPGSLVDLTNLTSFVDLGASLQARFSGMIESPNLSSLTGVSLIINDGTGSLDTGQLTAVVNGGVIVAGGGTLDLSNVTDLHGTSVSLSSGGKAILTNAANINGASFSVGGGVTLSLPAAVTYQHTGGSNDDRVFRAGGVGSALDLSALTAITVSGVLVDLHVEALNGGHIDLSGVTTISGLSGSLGGTQILADGLGSLVDLTNLTSIVDGDGSLQARNSGTIESPNLSSLTGVSLIDDGTGSLDIAQLTAILGGGVTVTGGTLDLSNVTTANGSSFIVSGGGTLSLPGLTSYTHIGGFTVDVTWRANGAGSTLNLPGLTSITGSNAVSADLIIQAMNGGQIDLGAVTMLLVPVTTGLFNGSIQLLADGTGSLIDLSAATSFIDNGNPDSRLEQRSAGVIIRPNLTTIVGVQIIV
jgi:hypothetical protein